MKEDPYYLGNHDTLPIQIIFKDGNRTIIHELPWDASPDAIMRAVHASMVGMTYSDYTVVHAMRDYAESYCEDYDEAEQKLDHTEMDLHDAEEQIHKLEEQIHKLELKYMARKGQVAQLRGELAALKGEPIPAEETEEEPDQVWDPIHALETYQDKVRDMEKEHVGDPVEGK